MALLAIQPIPSTGLEAAYVAATVSGDTCRPSAGLVLHVKNANVADRTVTLVRPGTEYGQANPDVPVVVTAGEERFIPVPRAFADTDGLIDITYSAVTGLTVSLLKVGI